MDITKISERVAKSVVSAYDTSKLIKLAQEANKLKHQFMDIGEGYGKAVRYVRDLGIRTDWIVSFNVKLYSVDVDDEIQAYLDAYPDAYEDILSDYSSRFLTDLKQTTGFKWAQAGRMGGHYVCAIQPPDFYLPDGNTDLAESIEDDVVVMFKEFIQDWEDEGESDFKEAERTLKNFNAWLKKTIGTLNKAEKEIQQGKKGFSSYLEEEVKQFIE